MSAQFIPFDQSDAHYHAYVEMHNAHWSLYPQTVVELRTLDKTRQPGHWLKRWLIKHNGTLAGVMELGRAEWAEQEGKCEINLIVLPPFRRKGVGTLALQYALRSTAKQLVLEIEAEANTTAPAGMAFLARQGFDLSTREFGSVLDLSSFCMTTNTPTSVRLSSYQELLHNDPAFWSKLHTLHVVLERDVPWHDEVHIEPVEQWVARRSAEPELLMPVSFVAIDRAGHYVGCTELFKRPAQDRYLYTGLTGVARTYRRIGLARALKVRSLQAARDLLRTRHGDYYQVLTENEVDNPMFVLNEKLGFNNLLEFYYYNKPLGDAAR